MSDEVKIPKVKLSDTIERQKNKGGLEVELSDGTSLFIPPPELWPDECFEIIQDPDKTDADLAEAMFGAKAWAQFKKDGGTVGMFNILIRERHNLEPGE